MTRGCSKYEHSHFDCKFSWIGYFNSSVFHSQSIDEDSNGIAMPQKLTTETRRANACYCTSTPKIPAGWVVDGKHGGAVCSSCGKPSPMTVFRECMLCEREFILKRCSPNWRPLYGVLSNGQCVKNEFFCTTCIPN